MRPRFEMVMGHIVIVGLCAFGTGYLMRQAMTIDSNAMAVLLAATSVVNGIMGYAMFESMWKFLKNDDS